MRLTPIILLLCAIAWVSCGGVPEHDEFVLGMSRADVTAEFGAPDQEQELTKSDERIWGPIETFWLEVPMGARVETWAFESTLEGQRGQTELYFVNGSDTVDGIGFHAEGAVYEGS